MPQNLTRTATTENNAFETYYQQYCRYSQNVKAQLAAESAFKNAGAERQKAKDALAAHESLHDSFVDQAYNASMERRIAAIESDYGKQIDELDLRIRGCDAEINRAKSGSLSASDVFEGLLNQRSRDFGWISQYREKADIDLQNYSVHLSGSLIKRILDQAKMELLSSISYESLRDIDGEVPDDYRVRAKRQGGIPISESLKAILLPPFILKRRKNKNGTYRKDGSKEINFVAAVIYWLLLCGLLWLGIKTKVLFAIILTGLLIFAAVMVIPRVLAAAKLKKASRFYMIVLERDRWIERLVKLEVDGQLTDSQTRLQEILGQLNAKHDQLTGERKELAAKCSMAKNSINADEVRRDADEEYNSELSRLTEQLTKAEKKLDQTKKRKEKLAQEIQTFIEAQDSSLTSIKNWAAGAQKDTKYLFTQGMLWDSLYFDTDGFYQDENGIMRMNKLEHDMRPQVLLYECDDIDAAAALDNLIIQMSGTAKMSYPDEFLKIFVVDTVGAAASYNKAQKILTPIGKSEQMKLLEKEVEDLQNRSKDGIAEENARRIENGDRPLHYIIAYIFIPKGEASANSNVLTAALRQQVLKKGRFGFLPIFLLSQDDWNQAGNKSGAAGSIVNEIKEQFVDSRDVHHVDYRKLILD